VNLQQGVTTSVKISQASKTRVAISFNGKQLFRPMVSQAVVDEYLGKSHTPLRVTVYHTSSLPLGYGYGTSGAGALSLSLAFNEATGSNLSPVQAAQIAHAAEVKYKTGLGTVTSAFYGGLLIRTRPGAPGFAQVQKLTPPSSLRVVSGAFGPISTAGVLSNINLKKRINLCGRGLVSLQVNAAETNSFLKLSRRFADCLGLFSPRLHEAISTIQRKRILSSMMMIGESLFTIVRRDLVPEVKSTVRSAGLTPVVSKIAEHGAVVL
jgi:pantoate kinase